MQSPRNGIHMISFVVPRGDRMYLLMVVEQGGWSQRYENVALSQFPFSPNESLVVLPHSSVASATSSVPLLSQRSTWGARRDPLYIVVPVTIIYALIFFTGVVGNVSTCIVIARNKSMHTATNYYLFSLAVSDLLLLVSGLPPEMYYIWSHFPYVFGEIFCVVQGFAAETSANATVLTITAFTVERYFAICHPFLSHTMSKLARAIKFIILIWIVALCLAVPQAMSVGIVYETLDDGSVPYEDHSICIVKGVVIPHAFEISTILFFVAPMTLITVLYVLIGLQLRRSSVVARGGTAGSSVSLKTRGVFKRKDRASAEVVAVMIPDNNSPGQINDSQVDDGRINYSRNVQNKATRHVVNMLVAVVVAFFICWAPFHAQRLLAIYGKQNAPHMVAVFNVLTYVSGILYYLSTTINPLLYHIMSNKFREAFKVTLMRQCGRGRRARRRTSGGVVNGNSVAVGRCYSMLSGRLSRNNSTSGASNVAGGCCCPSVGTIRYLPESENFRDYDRPLVVSFRRRSRPREFKSSKRPSEPRTASSPLATSSSSSSSSSLSSHQHQYRETHRQRSSSSSRRAEIIEAAGIRGFDWIDGRETGIELVGRRSDEVEPKVTSTSTENYARVEDIEIFQEQRLVMRSAKKSSNQSNKRPSKLEINLEGITGHKTTCFCNLERIRTVTND